MATLVHVAKGGAALAVHPDALADHLRLGWAVLAEQPTSEPEAEPLDDLRAEASDLGVTVDKRWSDKRIREEIDKAKEAGRD